MRISNLFPIWNQEGDFCSVNMRVSCSLKMRSPEVGCIYNCKDIQSLCSLCWLKQSAKIQKKIQNKDVNAVVMWLRRSFCWLEHLPKSNWIRCHCPSLSIQILRYRYRYKHKYKYKCCRLVIQTSHLLTRMFAQIQPDPMSLFLFIDKSTKKYNAKYKYKSKCSHHVIQTILLLTWTFAQIQLDSIPSSLFINTNIKIQIQIKIQTQIQIQMQSSCDSDDPSADSNVCPNPMPLFFFIRSANNALRQTSTSALTWQKSSN